MTFSELVDALLCLQLHNEAREKNEKCKIIALKLHVGLVLIETSFDLLLIAPIKIILNTF